MTSRFASYSSRHSRRWDRLVLLKWFLLFFVVVMIGRLFQLQILDYQQYSTYAQQRMKDKIITARRGKIMLKDGTHGFFELANNVSLELLFADPFIIQERIKEKTRLMQENPERAKKFYAPSASEIANLIAPILFEMVKEQSANCDQDSFCISQALEDIFFEEKRFREQQEYKKRQLLDPAFQIPISVVKTEKELLEEYIADLTSELSKTTRENIVLQWNNSLEIIKKIQDLRLAGITTTENSIIAFPLQIQNPSQAAALLEPLLEIPRVDLESLLTPKSNRYIKILNRIDFETAEKIRLLKIIGLGFSQEHWRNYAEQEDRSFAAQVIGFLDNISTPLYGVEKSMNEVLAGKTGHIRGEVDLRGRMLTARSSSIEQAINGSDVVLTLDQVIQNKAEALLEEQVKISQARSGEMIIQNPFTGAILAMAIYPSFNPNHPGSAYEKEPIELTEAQIMSLEEVDQNGEKHYYLPLNPGYRIEIFKQENNTFLKYKNKEGIRVYRNSIVSDIYEPGSVFKAIIMAAAIDSKEVRPSDIYHDNGPLQVDCHTVKTEQICDYTIKNSTDQYFGAVTMTQILEKSLNTGMAYISKKLGPNLFYDYLKNFGFGEKTFIELTEEHTGKLPHYRNWISESDMITKAFGQGIAVTPIQLITAFSAVVNGGLLIQPTLIFGIIDESGNMRENKPNIIRRVVDASSSEIMKAMLVSSVERGYAKRGGVAGYKVGGKTGTSQIATKGVYEKGEGSTIASFAGFAPYQNPRFVILVKINRPRTSIWGEANAAPLFNKMTEFLLNYFQIPPDQQIVSNNSSE